MNLENREFRGEDQWTESQTSVKMQKNKCKGEAQSLKFKEKRKKWRRLKATSMGGWGRLWENTMRQGNRETNERCKGEERVA